MSETSVVAKEHKKFHLPKCLSFLTDPQSGFYYYLFMVALGVLYLGFSLLTNYFTTPFTGDYTSQQYAFVTNNYDDWWHFFKTGEFVLYDTNTFLGASNIGSNSFYNLFDPFFLPILFFPRNFIPQALAIINMFRMALGGLLFSIYLRYLGLKKYTSRLAGVMYAFCGWTTWVLWFHYIDVAVIFPIILLGVEKVLKEKKPWLLAFALFLIGLTNFFFFYTFIISGFLYAMFRFFQRIKTYNVKEAFLVLGIGFLGFFIGCLLAAVIVVPATIVALQAPRAVNTNYLNILKTALNNGDLGTFFYRLFSWEADNTSFRTYYPIIEFVFPVMSDRGTPLVKMGNETYDNIAGSLFSYSPSVIFLVPALISSAKKKHFSPLIATALFVLMLFTPFCYYAFHGFAYAYSRWTIFVTTSLITYVAFYMDNIRNEPRWHIFVGGGFALGMGVAAIVCAVHVVNTYPTFRLRYVYEELGTYGFLAIEAALYAVYVIVLCTLIYIYFNKKQLKSILIFAVLIEVVLMGNATLEGHGYEDYMDVNGGYDNNVAFQTLIEQIKRDDPTYYRCYSSQENVTARNDSMRHDYNGLGMFHSVYNFNTGAFLNWSEITDYVAPGSYAASYIEKRQDLDTFLGIKYYFVNKDKAFYGDEVAASRKSKYYRANVPLGFKDVSNEYPNDKYYVYRNENFIDFAFSYDQVASYYNLDDEGKVKEPLQLYPHTFQNEDLYLKAAIIGKSNLDYVKDYIPESNIRDFSQYSIDMDVRFISQLTYDTTYYIIHDDTKDRKDDASKESFVSKLFDLSEYESTKTKPENSEYNGRYVTVMEMKNTFPYDENGLALYLLDAYQDKYGINVYITTKDEHGDEKFLTYDNHNDDYFSINWANRKNWRGLYVAPTYDTFGNKVAPQKVSKIIIVAKRTSVDDYIFAYKTGTNVINVNNKLKEYPITDINYRTNHFDFKTNFDSYRVIVTQLAYEDGWKLRANYKDGTSKELKIFTAQGGFVSFVSEVGEVTYSLDYYTPYLTLASYVSSIGVFLFSTSLIAYLYVSLNFMVEDTKKDKIFRRNPIKYPLF